MDISEMKTRTHFAYRIDVWDDGRSKDGPKRLRGRVNGGKEAARGGAA